MLNQWFFAVHFIIILIAKKKNNLIDCSAFLSDSSTKKIYVLRDQKCHNSGISVAMGDCHECPQYEWNKHIQEYT